MQEVRVCFSKFSTAKYISHLDLMRTVTRAMTRAQIPLWYTEGFNPHPFLTFALPLPLGIESECESFDIRIVGDISNEQIKNRLNRTLPEGLEVTGVLSDFLKSNDISFAEYFTVFEFENEENAVEYSNNISLILGSDELITCKKAKKKGKKIDVEVNLKDYIDSYEISLNSDTVELSCVLCAGNVRNLNPTVLFERLNRDLTVRPSLTRIKKIRMLTADKKVFY